MSKRAVAEIQHGGVRLRLLTAADLPLTLAWRNRDDIRRWFIHSDAISPEQHQAWFDGYCSRDDDFVFIIEECRRLHRPVGQISLYHVDWVAKRAEYGRLMIGDPAAQGQGLARAATRLLLVVAWSLFQLEEIYLEVFQHNLPAIAVYRDCGFRPCGQRDSLLQMTVLKPYDSAARASCP